MYNTFDDKKTAAWSAYQSLSKDQDSRSMLSLSNPIYAEAYRFAAFQKKSELYCKRYAQEIVQSDHSIDLDKIAKAVADYENAFRICKERGCSELLSSTYADQVSQGVQGKYAYVYAQCYESKIEEQMNDFDARVYADILTDYFCQHEPERLVIDPTHGVMWMEENRDDFNVLFCLEQADAYTQWKLRARKSSLTNEEIDRFSIFFLAEYGNRRCGKNGIPTAAHKEAIDFAEEYAIAYYEKSRKEK